MYNFNDINLAQERYQEMVKTVELNAKYDRDESGISTINKRQHTSWKTQLQNVLTPLFGRKNALQRTR